MQDVDFLWHRKKFMPNAPWCITVGRKHNEIIIITFLIIFVAARFKGKTNF